MKYNGFESALSLFFRSHRRQMSAMCLNLFEEKRQTERKTSWLTKCKCGKTPAFFIFLLYIWIFG